MCRRSRVVPAGGSRLERIIGDRHRAGDIGAQNALHLFDELLQQARPSSIRVINGLLTVVACDAPALAVSLFNRIARAGAEKLAPTVHTYGILVGCCCRTGRPDLGFAALGHAIKAGFAVKAAVTFNQLLKGLCAKKRTSDAMDIVLRQMPEIGCMPTVVSYNILLKGLCDEVRSEGALELIRMMADDGGTRAAARQMWCPITPSWMAADSLFREMLDHGISPDAMTYSSIISGLCKAQAMDKTEVVLQQMFDNGVLPNNSIYNSLIHVYCSSGQCKEAVRFFRKMSRDGQPDVVTYNLLINYLCKSGRCTEAREIFDFMTDIGQNLMDRTG